MILLADSAENSCSNRSCITTMVKLRITIRIKPDQQQNKLNKEQYAENDGDKPKYLMRRGEGIPPLIYRKAFSHWH